MGIIRVGIIGLGRMGMTHFSILNPRKDVEIVAVAESSGLIRSILGKYIPDIKLFEDYKELLDAGIVDAIIVCTPPNYHYPVIKMAGQRGIHVFSEKPFTTKSSEGSELSKDFIGKGLVNQVGYVNRYNDIFLKTREILESGIIGQVMRFSSEMYSATVIKPESGDGWRSSTKHGGGVVYEMASHSIDLVNFLIGKPDKVIGSVLSRVYSKNVDDIVSSTFTYKNGVAGTICVNWSDSSFRKPTNKIEIAGTEGKILADQHSLKIFLSSENPALNLIKGWNTFHITDIFRPVPFYVRGNEFTRQLYEFIDCIQGEANRNLCTFGDGVNTLQIIEAIFEDYYKNSTL
ncbi:MAG: Gfo/Idh/MocA family oxidoreductase [Bacteroidales bacterium]|jgi:predicted dehydrogenase|nr:Gfo/Idh/MocA family oxidoreductase [Bacteroidales bacterium]